MMYVEGEYYKAQYNNETIVVEYGVTNVIKEGEYTLRLWGFKSIINDTTYCIFDLQNIDPTPIKRKQ